MNASRYIRVCYCGEVGAHNRAVHCTAEAGHAAKGPSITHFSATISSVVQDSGRAYLESLSSGILSCQVGGARQCRGNAN